MARVVGRSGSSKLVDASELVAGTGGLVKEGPDSHRQSGKN